MVIYFIPNSEFIPLSLSPLITHCCKSMMLQQQQKTATKQKVIQEQQHYRKRPQTGDYPKPSSVQFSCSLMSYSLRPHELQHTRPPCPSTNSWSLLKLMPIELVMPSSHLILCHPLLLLPPIPPSIRVFSNESTLLMVAKVLEFQLQHQSFQ